MPFSTGPSHSLLEVPNVLPSFPRVRWAAAYGSAALLQAGYKKKGGSMIDYVFVVDSSRDWHRENIRENPQHYSWLMKWCGADVVGWIQDHIGGGVYYNTLVDWKDRRIKYGVVSITKLREDLENWDHLYLAGRMQKPVVTLRQDEQVEAANQTNLSNAVRIARLLLPARFSEQELFCTIAGLSYLGDYRMQMGESPNKVKNIVDGNVAAFKKLYSGAISKQPGLRAIDGKDTTCARYEQDVSFTARTALLRSLPRKLTERLLVAHGGRHSSAGGSSPGDVVAQLAESSALPDTVRAAVGQVVRRSSISQSFKALLTAGLGKCLMYLGQKIQGVRSRSK